MVWDPCGCDMARKATRTHASACVVLMWRGRVADPRESTWMPGWCLRGKKVFGLADDGPMG